MKKNIFLTIFIFTLSISQLYAFDTNLEVDKNKITADERVTLHLTIENATDGNFDVQKIEGLDNFDIVGKSQSSSFSSINGQTSSNISVDISLSPKKKGHYTLGPVTVSDGKISKKTKSVSVEVTGEKLFIGGGNALGTPLSHNNSSNLEQEFIPDHSSPQDNDFKIWFLGIGVMVMFFVVYFALNKIKNPISTEKKSLISSQEDTSNDGIPKIIEYPALTDKEFIRKIETIFKQKLAEKYHISSLQTKDNSEILLEIGEKNEEIESIFGLIQKAKYSNLITNHELILEKIQHFNV